MNNYSYEIRKTAGEIVNDFFSNKIKSLQDGYDKAMETNEYNNKVGKHIANEINKLAFLNLFDKTEDKTFEFDLVEPKQESMVKVAKQNFTEDKHFIVKTASSELNYSHNSGPSIYVSPESVQDLSETALIAVKDKLSSKSYKKSIIDNKIEKTAEELKKLAEENDAKQYAYIINKIDQEGIASDYVNQVFNYEGEEFDLPINESSGFYKMASDFINNVTNSNKLDEDINDIMDDISNLEKISEVIYKIENNNNELSNFYNAVAELNDNYRGN